ncbi:unnamed protein product [Adineta ricciae]|uniref:Aminotransferase class I/classII large domain-containing protein n=1 Tax=Adineta ricciae TaxID=249248 RepID=A0A814BRY4_ADIRI|nr:unnamed protein product [Adineta ricciae]CAF1179923.1 unnamed protein product [Adineta ricciae]
MPMYSNRAKLMDDDCSLLLWYKSRVQLNQYDEKQNPQGICNLGVAENHLCEEELIAKMRSVSSWSGQFNYYPDSSGEFPFRQRLCAFFSETFCSMQTTLDPARMLISSGVSGTIALLSVLIADAGDVFLIASPYYTAFDFDVAAMARNSLIKCPLLNQDIGEFSLSVEIFKQGYESAVAQNLRPRAIVLVNPHNPLGDIYDEAVMQPILEFAAEKRLHVIVDEIYALSVFQNQRPFKSILNYTSIPDPERTHFLWSFSKDFALSGTRVGVLYAGTKDICRVGTKLNFLMVPSSAIQMTLKLILDDREWTNAYLKLNQCRLTEQYQYAKNQIEQMDKRIRIRDAQAGLFLWIDFRSILTKVTFEEEHKLFDEFFNHGIYITNGLTIGCSEPGWFRMVFTVKNKWIQEGIERMKQALNTYKLSSS